MRLPAKLSELGSFLPSEGEVGGGGRSGQYVAASLLLIKCWPQDGSILT
jgi:hypothetical protein